MKGALSMLRSNVNGSEPMERVFFSVSEVAESFGVSRKTVYRLLHRGLLQSSSALRHKKIPRGSVESFLATTVNHGGDL
jgi:excisionase family DNA binding protein